MGVIEEQRGVKDVSMIRMQIDKYEIVKELV